MQRGNRYELCRSVHAEANAIISAPRKDMIDATLYLVGIENDIQDYVPNIDSCTMCKRMIINSGIEKVVMRVNKDEFKLINVEEWVIQEDVFEGAEGY